VAGKLPFLKGKHLHTKRKWWRGIQLAAFSAGDAFFPVFWGLSFEHEAVMMKER